MGLKLNVSNSLYQLVDYLYDDLAKPLKNVFQPRFIVTQTLGMNNWLKIQLADRLGITANCRFYKPNDMISQLYFILGGQKEQVLSVDSLQWILFDLLDQSNFKDRYPYISNYYAENDEVKRMALAGKIADLFDQYQIYRPDMINEWGSFQVGNESVSNWQQYLWMKAKDKLGVKMPDKTTIGKFIIESLQQVDKQQKLVDSVSHLHIFGISIITAYHLEIFQVMAKYIDISFHLLNPAPSQYWFEDKSGKQIAYWKKKRDLENFLPPIEGNGLLTHWGKVIQDTFSLFFKNEDFLNEYNDEVTQEPLANTLLSKIQHDIFHNALAGERNELTLADIKDGSLTMHACYTPSREIEVLYNYLVHLVAERGNRLSPRDIVVMVSDIDSYAPYIKAIFTSAPYFFPFTIADESMHSSDGLFSVLQALMALHEENFKAEDVLQLLEFSAVRKRFHVSDMELIRKVVKAANIRFGIAGNSHDDSVTVSWLNGLNRIMYGICMSGEEEYKVEGYGIYPVDMVEGSEAFEVIRFCHFVQLLIELVKEQKKERSLAEWGKYITYAVSQLLFYPEEQDNEDYHYLIRYLEQLNNLAEDLPDKVNFLVFKQSFLKKIAGETRSGNFASGGITFCSLIPMRSIPFKVVALLGLDFDKFPRKESAISFNLLDLHPRRGDRNVKNNDKHLFLETILSAQDYLYISYIGRDVKNNDPRPPSALVDELIEYIRQGVKGGIAADQLLTVHPLHGYSQRYSNKEGNLFTYLGEDERRIENAVPEDPDSGKCIDFDLVLIPQFVSFFKNPFKAYYQRVLDINYWEEDILLSSNECFELNALQRWQLKQDLLFTDDLEGYQYKAVKKGRLPLKNMASVEMDEIMQHVVPVRSLLSGLLTNEEEHFIDIEVRIENTVFKGRMDRVFDGQQVFAAFSKDEYKYLLEAYLKHLFAIAGGQFVSTVYVSESHQQVYTIDRHSISREDAMDRIKILLRLYKSGWDSPLIYSPAFENNPGKLEKLDAISFRNDLENRIMRTQYPIKDPYIRKEFEGGFFDQQDVFDQYLHNWNLIFAPVIEVFPGYFQPKNKA